MEILKKIPERKIENVAGSVSLSLPMGVVVNASSIHALAPSYGGDHGNFNMNLPRIL
jgi:hypothetical protein